MRPRAGPSGRIGLVLTGRTHFSTRVTASPAWSTGFARPRPSGPRPSPPTGAARQAEWGPGQIVLLSDHLNLTGATLLTGATFVDMTDAYSPELRALARTVNPICQKGCTASLRSPVRRQPRCAWRACSAGTSWGCRPG